MRIIWSTQDVFRSFYSPTIHKVDVVSSRLVRGARGQTISGFLTLVTDENDKFCDLEMVLAEESRIDYLAAPQEAVRVEGVANTYIDDMAEVRWSFDESLDILLINFLSDSPRQWLEVQRGYLYLGVDLRGQLGAIVLKNIETDSDGELQNSWLERLEAGLG